MPEPAGRRRPRRISTRRAARIGAVQALYQIEITGAAAPAVVAEFQEHRLADVLEPLDDVRRAPPVDAAWFERLVLGTVAAAPRLDPLIEERMQTGRSLAQSGFLLRACLRAGAFEVAEFADVPVAVVINEYVEIARDFLPGNEPALVHAVLDGVGRRLRPDAPPEDGA